MTHSKKRFSSLSAHGALGLLMVLLMNASAGNDTGPIQFDTDFDSGGGVSADSRSDIHFELTLEDEQGYNPLGYMHFRLQGVEGKTVSFEFTNLDDSRMPSDFRLLYSETPLDELDYQRMDDPIGDGFSQGFQSDTVYIANYFPFPYENTVEQVTRHQDSEYVTVEVIGQSHEGRDMYAMRISDPDVPDDEKRDIVALTRQHPGETTGSYQMDGMIAYVLDVFREETREFDDDYRFHFVPHANPDGIYRGIHRLCSQGYDLNRQWDSDSPVEIRNIKDYLERNVTNAWWGFDLHATTNRTFTSLFYTRAASEQHIDLVESIAAHIESLDGIGESEAPQQARGFYYEALGGSMVVTEKWLYSEAYDAEYLRSQGRNFLQEVVAPSPPLRAEASTPLWPLGRPADAGARK
ncbi:MAG: M14-type cytosolic carboxypeptidase [Candidatus Hydrogenedentota bacterium]